MKKQELLRLKKVLIIAYFSTFIFYEFAILAGDYVLPALTFLLQLLAIIAVHKIDQLLGDRD